MLKEVYGISDGSSGDQRLNLIDIYNASEKLVRGSDSRKQHLLDVDINFCNNEIIPLIFGG